MRKLYTNCTRSLPLRLRTQTYFRWSFQRGIRLCVLYIPCQNRKISIWVRHQQDLASHFKTESGWLLISKTYPRQFQFYNIVTCLLRWLVSTIEREKSGKRAVLYPNILVMPFEHSSGEFPLLFWLVLPFCETHMICQVYSGFAWNFTEWFELPFLFTNQ